MKTLKYSIFTLYLVLGIYVLGITIHTPFVSILLDTTSGQPVIENTYYSQWAQRDVLNKAILW